MDSFFRRALARIRYEIDWESRRRFAFHNAIIHPLTVALPRSIAERLHGFSATGDIHE